MATEEDKTTPEVSKETKAPVAPEKGKKTNKIWIIIGVIVAIIVILPFLASIVFGGIIGAAIFHNVKVDKNGNYEVGIGDNKVNVSTNENQKWPDTVPSIVPKYTGKITASTRFGETWTITSSNVTTTDYDKYISSLKTAGFTMDEAVDMGGLKNAGGTKDGYRVNVTLTTDSQGTGMLIGVTKDTTNKTE